MLYLKYEYKTIYFCGGGGNVKLLKNKIEVISARNCMTISKVAAAYGVSRVRMSVILNQDEITPVCAGRLASALGVDVTEILEN